MSLLLWTLTFFVAYGVVLLFAYALCRSAGDYDRQTDRLIADLRSDRLSLTDQRPQRTRRPHLRMVRDDNSGEQLD
jgi:hypothetical protein